MTAQDREIECKYRIKGPAALRKRLVAMKARKIRSGRETNEFYDQNGRLESERTALRLRKAGSRAWLTLKGPREMTDGGISERLEIETPVLFSATRRLLLKLGYKCVARYAKHREEYTAGRAHVVIDHIPGLGWFSEIEASRSVIRRLAGKLGLKDSSVEPRSYMELLFGSPA